MNSIVEDSTVKTVNSERWMTASRVEGQWVLCKWYEFSNLEEEWFHESELFLVDTDFEIEAEPDEALANLLIQNDAESFFDEYIHDECSDMASAINNDGPLSQIRFLLDRGWSLKDLKHDVDKAMES